MTFQPDYVLDQLARALATAEQHADLAVRQRATEKVRKWRQVFAGAGDGSLRVGSRTPVADIPAWATLEVAHGGFATGSLLADGPLLPHELELQRRLGVTAPGRTALNLHYLSDAGRAELVAMLASGCYRVDVPEEGALPMVAWLLAHEAPAEAEQLLETIAPYFDRLRFFPAPHARPLVAATTVRLQSVGKTAEDLGATRERQRVRTMNEALTVWAPLEDRAVGLFLETVEGALPTLRKSTDGELARRTDGHPYVDGGWPCRVYPADWAARAKALLADYERARAVHGLSGKPERRKENFALLRGYLARAIDDPRALTGRDVGMLRKVLASVVARRGAPGSEALAQLRARRAELGSRPTHGQLRAVVMRRLAARSADDGLESLDAVAAPVTEEESEQLGVRAEARIPDGVARKLARSLEAPVEELVQRGVIPSAEVLGRVLPQLTSQIRAAGIADPALRTLYAAVYAAFRRRRSLLLRKLEHQVTLEELPWVSAMSAFRRASTDEHDAARESLRQVSLLAITSFPQTILPNTLLRELAALATSARLTLPLVDELAADIFMGTFSAKFLRAAQLAASVLEGSLYERYYGLRFEEVRRIDDVRSGPYGVLISEAFEAMCTELAGTGTWSVAQNGKIIEQEQILTTHNLATLFAEADLNERLRGELFELARRCFVWICQERQDRGNRRARLRAVKDRAYAFRQMLFYLSVGDGSLDDFARWATEHFEGRSAAFRASFAPFFRGLTDVASGGHFDARGVTADGGRRLLGWTTDEDAGLSKAPKA